MSAASLWTSPLGKLRLLGFFEGLSFVLLVAIGMPLKYWMGDPLAVRILGPIHGFLFVGLCVLLAQAVFEHGLAKRKGAIVFVAALLPFGPFVIDGWLKRQEASLPKEETSA